MQRFFILIFAVVIIGCGGGVENDTPLPNSIQDMQLQKVIQGDEADQIITELHRKVVTDQQNFIGKYAGNGYDATLYLTVYQEADSALSDLNKMQTRIQDPQIGGQMGFQHTRALTSMGENIYMALQNSRAHYFYVDGNALYWLDADPHNAMPAIKQLVE